MKAYVITTGIVFVLITVAHLVRMTQEAHILNEPIFLIITILAAALSVWAWVIFRRLGR
jgi:hypothetical protein